MELVERVWSCQVPTSRFLIREVGDALCFFTDQVHGLAWEHCQFVPRLCTHDMRPLTSDQ